MAKKMYLGIDGIARKIKKGYLGIDGIARKIKKGYLGVGGVARPFWTGDEPFYYGTIDPTYGYTGSRYYSNVSCLSTESYAMFAGGKPTHSGDHAETKKASAYDESLVRYDLTSLVESTSGAGAASIGEYGIFAGGGYQGAYSYYTHNYTRVYNSSLTVVSASNLSSKRNSMGSASIGNYALFGGGSTGTKSVESVTAYWSCLSSVETYNSSLTRSSATSLSETKMQVVSGTVTGYALFIGGYRDIRQDFDSRQSVDAYNESLTKQRLDDFTQVSSIWKSSVQTLSLNGKLLIFMNSRNFIYDSSLTYTYIYDDANYRNGGTAVALGKYGLYAGGNVYVNGTLSGHALETVLYDESLTKSLIEGLHIPRTPSCAATVGQYAIIGTGGYYSDTVPDESVEKYILSDVYSF